MLKYLPITAAMIVLIVAAVFLRLPDLGLRPFHNDEAVNAAKAEELWRTGEYRYDPEEFHGPTLPYFTLPFISISGADSYAEIDEGMFRGVAVLFGVLAVWLTIFTGRYIGWPAAVIAAGLVTVSPAFIYWSRYYIHEMLLVLFTLGAIQAAWRYTEKRSLPLAALVGAFFGLMHATKETGALSGFAMLLALLSMNLVDYVAIRNSRGTTFAGFIRSLVPVPPSHLLLGLAAFVLVVIVLFTSFFTNWRGPIDSIATYANWIGMGTSGNEGRHLNPWHYYFDVLWWNPIGSVRMMPLFSGGEGPSVMPSVFTESVVLLMALIGLLAAAFRFGIADRLMPYVRFLALYTVILTLVYCVIPYKTPWSMLSFYHGFIMMAGVGAAAVWNQATKRRSDEATKGRIPPLVASTLRRSVAFLFPALLLFAAIHFAWQSVLLNQRFYAHHLNPYAYSQPGLDVRRIAERAEQIAAVSDEGREMVIRVIHGGNYGPLPYYLRGFPRVGYHPIIPEQPDAAIIIADPNLADRIDELVQHEYHHEYYGLRRHAPVEVYIRRDLWDRFIAAQQSP